MVIKTGDDVARRRKAILAILVREGFASIADMAEQAGVSEHTIRRDLEALAAQGLVNRVRGGGVPARPERSREEPVLYAEEKRRMGRLAASLVGPGETVCIDAGSTTREVAAQLPDGVGVLTNAVNIAYELGLRGAKIDVALTGGSVASGDYRWGLTGPLALHSIISARLVSKAIIGAQGVDLAAGVTDRWHYLCEVKRAMISVAETVILVVDASKFGRKHLSVVCPMSEIDIVVTDSRIADEQLKKLRESRLDVRVA